MRRFTLLLLVAGGVVAGLPATSSAKEEVTATTSIDCTDPDPKKHGSIQVALESSADTLTIEISGVCDEDVLIERDNVTLIGSDPTLDGIRAVDTENIRGATVYVRNSRFVRLENLLLTGAVHSGVRVINSDTVVEVVNCRLEGNGVVGLGSIHSVVSVADSTLIGNARGITALGGQLFCTGCEVESTSIGVLVLNSTQVSLTDSTVDAGSWGLAAFGSHPGIDVTDSEVTSPSFALLASNGAAIRADGTTFDGSLFAEQKSLLVLTDSEQIANPLAFNSLSLDSTLQLEGTSTLVGQTFLNGFSKAVMASPSVHDGDLHCASGSDAFCDDPLTQVTGGSSCGQCM